MTLPATPPISLLQILTEFHAPLGTPLSELLKGGTYVSDEVEADIPEELPISVLQFLGATRPAEVSISGLTAIGGSLSSTSIDDMDAETTFTHPTGSANTEVSATGSVEVTVLVSRATTAKLRLTPQATNAVVQSIYRSPFTTKAYPVLDNGANFIDGGAVAVIDDAGERQGTWQIESPVTDVGTSEVNRIAQALVISNAAADGQSYTFSIPVYHEVKAYIGGSLGFGQNFDHNIVGGFVTLSLSLLFLNPAGDTIVQEIPLTVRVNTAGLLRATAITYTP